MHMLFNKHFIIRCSYMDKVYTKVVLMKVSTGIQILKIDIKITGDSYNYTVHIVIYKHFYL
jgi:hypothetical protein